MDRLPGFTPRWLSTRRILIVAASTSYDGEVALGLANLRQALPYTRLVLWSFGPHNVPPASVDEILPAPLDWPAYRAIRDAVVTIGKQGFDAAVILSPRGVSPYPAGYVCYMAGIRIRIGQSLEFGGGVLSHWEKPLPNTGPGEEYNNLIRAVGLLLPSVNDLDQTLRTPGENT